MRQTRGALKKKGSESNDQTQSNAEEAINKIFVVPPKNGQSETLLSPDSLKLIETKAKLRA